MGWSYPDITLEELMRHIKGFVDILILASGYQSSGFPAIWDLENIKKALRWGIFFEQVFKRIHDSIDYKDSLEELDAALFDLTSNLYFPQGLARMSSTHFLRARELIIGHLLQIHPLRDAHLLSLLSAIIEIDTETANCSTHIYLDKLMLRIESLNLIPEGTCSVKDSSASSLGNGLGTSVGLKYTVQNPRPAVPSCVEPEECLIVGHSCFILQELLKRQATELCISSLEACLDSVLKSFARNHVVGSAINPSKGQPSYGGSSKFSGLHTGCLVRYSLAPSHCLVRFSGLHTRLGPTCSKQNWKASWCRKRKRKGFQCCSGKESDNSKTC